MNNYSLTYSQFGCCGNSRFNLLRSFSSSLRDIAQASLALFPLRSSVLQKYVVNNLVMCENRVHTHTHTHSHRAYFTKYFLNVKELAIPFCIIWATVQHYWSKLHTAFTLHQISLVTLTVSSNLYLRNGAPPLRVAAREALHHHITALPVGTHRAMLETPYFHFNY